ncbi:hypothetical protein D9M71_266040 [compost metagenome]
MVAADIAVARQTAILVRRAVFEYFQVGAVAAADHLEVADGGARVHVEVALHPVVLEPELAEGEVRLAAEHLDEEGHRLGQVGYGDADVLQPAHAGQAARRHARWGRESHVDAPERPFLLLAYPADQQRAGAQPSSQDACQARPEWPSS